MIPTPSSSASASADLDSFLVGASLLSGNVVVFGPANSGKTSLTESMVSLAVKASAQRSKLSVGQQFTPRVVSASLSSWASPNVFNALVNKAAMTMDEYDDIAREVLVASNLTTPIALSSLLSRHPSVKTNEFMNRLGHCMRHFMASGVTVAEWQDGTKPGSKVSPDDGSIIKSYHQARRPASLISIHNKEDEGSTSPSAFTLYIPLSNRRATNMNVYAVVDIVKDKNGKRFVDHVSLTADDLPNLQNHQALEEVDSDMAKGLADIIPPLLEDVNAFFNPDGSQTPIFTKAKLLDVKLGREEAGLVTSVTSNAKGELALVWTHRGVLLMQVYDRNNLTHNTEINVRGPGDGYLVPERLTATMEELNKKFNTDVEVIAGDDEIVFPVAIGSSRFFGFTETKNDSALTTILVGTSGDKELLSLASAKDQSDMMSASSETAVKGIALFYTWLAQQFPSMAYQLLVDTELLVDDCAINHESSRLIGSVLRDAWLELNIKSGPCLILTEDKAKSAYSMIASNDSLESTMTQLQLNTFDGIIDASVSCSLLTATVGAMLFADVIHISTLDLTMVGDIAVKSATQKGGLDSSALNMLQFISNTAALSGKLALTEMRDDFTKGESTDQAIEDARTTLGANSKVAIQIWADKGNTNSRNIWMRFKGGEQVADQSKEFFSVSKDQYPENTLRNSDILPSLTEFSAPFLSLLNKK